MKLLIAVFVAYVYFTFEVLKMCYNIYKGQQELERYKQVSDIIVII